jgi:hypothetical protein
VLPDEQEEAGAARVEEGVGVVEALELGDKMEFVLRARLSGSEGDVLVLVKERETVREIASKVEGEAQVRMLWLGVVLGVC